MIPFHWFSTKPVKGLKHIPHNTTSMIVFWHLKRVCVEATFVEKNTSFHYICLVSYEVLWYCLTRRQFNNLIFHEIPLYKLFTCRDL